MTLAFYRVNNSKGYDRRTFDYASAQDVEKALLPLLETDEARFYGIDKKGLDLQFQEDYNGEILDGGWWCVSF